MINQIKQNTEEGDEMFKLAAKFSLLNITIYYLNAISVQIVDDRSPPQLRYLFNVSGFAFPDAFITVLNSKFSFQTGYQSRQKIPVYTAF